MRVAERARRRDELAILDVKKRGFHLAPLVRNAKPSLLLRDRSTWSEWTNSEFGIRAPGARKLRLRPIDELLERAECQQQEVEDHTERGVALTMKAASRGAAMPTASLAMFVLTRSGLSSRRTKNHAGKEKWN
jgi:hypothetical protein